MSITATALTFMYGWSVLHCLPVGRVDPPALGTGTVMRPDTLRRYAGQAGFSGVEILPSSTISGGSTRLRV